MLQISYNWGMRHFYSFEGSMVISMTYYITYLKLFAASRGGDYFYTMVFLSDHPFNLQNKTLRHKTLHGIITIWGLIYMQAAIHDLL